jgi:hypothetical protein
MIFLVSLPVPFRSPARLSGFLTITAPVILLRISHDHLAGDPV